MRRGVRWRTLYSASAKLSGGAPEFARIVTALGNEVRTTHLAFQRTILIDDTAALLPALQEYNDEGQPRAWLVRDTAGLEFARRQFEAAWAFASPWLFPAPDEGTFSSAMQRQILRGLLGGNTQKAVASALSISANWASQLLNDLMKRLNLNTREQLIKWWLESDEQHLP
jgi:DNA-binding CsgD family transcriptional regulator